MIPHVIFVVLSGSAEVTVNLEKANLHEGQCLITKPAILSMKTEKGARIMGIQVFRS